MPGQQRQSWFSRLFGGSQDSQRETANPEYGGQSAVTGVAQTSTTPLLDQVEEQQAAQQDLSEFAGYGADWHQSQDALIQRVVADFNEEKGWDTDHAHYLDANLVKAWALQESGGHKNVFTSGDMMQVNVTGDYVPEKKHFGLEKREKVDPEKSLRTALDWAYYKGEVTKGMKGGTPDEGWHPTQRGTKSQPGYQSKFVGWKKALTNYNGGGVQDYFGKIDRRYQSGS